MNLKNIIKPEYCILLSSTTKTEAFMELFEVVEKQGSIQDMENLKKEVFFREQLLSTGIGQGIGIPHVRYDGVTDPLIVVGVQPEGIEDYGSMDGEPVYLLFLFIVGKEKHKEYLRLLALTSQKLKDSNFRDLLLHSKSGKEIASVLIGESE